LKKVTVMADESKGVSIIDKDLRVEGTIHARGRLLIGGQVQGAVVGDQVTTARGSRVVAWAKVGEMVIAGEFEGDVTAYRSLKILPTGNLRGNVIYRSLCLEAGGVLNGNARPLQPQDEILAIGMEPSAEAPKPSPKGAGGDAGKAGSPKTR
jgi:cytoskeletal protein CcmA (bactofilin family)